MARRPPRPEHGRALFYTRDSGGKHEQTPLEYLAWAQREISRLQLQFDGTPQAIQELMRSGESNRGDLYFDYCVQGHLLSRPALDALKQRLQTDTSISHLFIPRRDRLARPDDPLDGVRLEQDLRQCGITLVFMDRTLSPLAANRRRDVVETLTTMLDYDVSGKFRQDLAAKVIYAQLRLAKQGFSAGGRPPFGFRRWLVTEAGTPVRELAAGEIVRQAGHHVVWLPGPEAELALIRRILTMLETMPASGVARQLTSEGIPSPDSGRQRTDNGVRHTVRGVWHQTTIINIARNSLLRAVVSYGQRSMGDQYRHTADGPRPLVEDDLRSDGKPKVVRNQGAALIKASGLFEPPVEPELVDRVEKLLDQRAGSQRGKPRSRQPGHNPLGGRVYDLNCTWPMYRAPYNGSFRYVCGSYWQSHGQECSHNHVDGLVATRFVLASLQQRVLRPDRLAKLREELLQRARAEESSQTAGLELRNKQAELDRIRNQLAAVTNNLSFAQSKEQFAAISQVFDDLKRSETKLEQEIVTLQRATSQQSSEQEVEAALDRLHRLSDLAKEPNDLPALTALFAALNVQLFVRFVPHQPKKRIVQKVVCGKLTVGDAPAPIEKYSGPTKRRYQQLAGAVDSPPVGGGPDCKSLRNVSRGDRI